MLKYTSKKLKKVIVRYYLGLRNAERNSQVTVPTFEIKSNAVRRSL